MKTSNIVEKNASYMDRMSIKGCKKMLPEELSLDEERTTSLSELKEVDASVIKRIEELKQEKAAMVQKLDCQ